MTKSGFRRRLLTESPAEELAFHFLKSSNLQTLRYAEVVCVLFSKYHDS